MSDLAASAPDPSLAEAAARVRNWLGARLDGPIGLPTAMLHALALDRVCGALGAANAMPCSLARPRDREAMEAIDPLTARLALASSAVGFVPLRAEPAESRVIDFSAVAEAFLSGPAGQRRAVAMVEKISDHGAASLTPNWLCADLMGGAALRAARAGDLITAMRAARSSLYLAEANPAVAAHIGDFVAPLQDDDGSFLSIGQVKTCIRRAPDFAFIVQATTNLHCLWALAELRCPSFRLMRKILALPKPALE